MNKRNSKCKKRNWYHNYQISVVYPYGVMEVCEKCRDKQFFKNNTPNRIYLSYHLRQGLQPYNRQFKHEYNK